MKKMMLMLPWVPLDEENSADSYGFPGIYSEAKRKREKG
jgi:hypothetical protein